MDEPIKDLEMRVDGMTGSGCADAVRKVIQGLDPKAQVDVDRAHSLVRIRTKAQTLDIADALTKKGYNATAMTG